MFLIGGQTAGLIQTKHCTWIQLDPEIILGKSRSECLYRHENGGEGQRHGNAIGTSIDSPRVTKVG